jgi:nitrite reductase/ring-hydroxylating ferredoxin subunit/uncharacterized membrane protein
MPVEDIVNSLTEQEWLDTPAVKLQQLVRDAYRAAGPVGESLKRFLHGSWLGHPLHPVLTDLPVGMWTAAAIFDVLDLAGAGEAMGQAADRAIATGEVFAAMAAVAGATDWHVLNGQRTRRVGVAHALANTTAAILQGASLLARGRGLRGAGRALSFLGLGALTAGAYLGGYLAYNLEVGTDHTADIQTPKEFVPVMAAADLPEGELRGANAGDTRVVLYRQDGRVHALVEKCAHLGGPLAKGHVEDGCLVCPWHASAYDLDTGEVKDGPSAYPQPVLEVRERDGQIEVKG